MHGQTVIDTDTDATERPTHATAIPTGVSNDWVSFFLSALSCSGAGTFSYHASAQLHTRSQSGNHALRTTAAEFDKDFNATVLNVFS